MNSKVKSAVIGVISFIILIALDQYTKQLAINNLMNKEPIPIIKDVFELQYLENRGAAFGMLQGQRTMFLILVIVVMAVIIFCYLRTPIDKKWTALKAIMILIAAGGVGNFIDRYQNAYVVDFLYFKLIDFPIFNVADIYVTCAAAFLIIIVLFKYKDADLDELKNAILGKKHE